MAGEHRASLRPVAIIGVCAVAVLLCIAWASLRFPSASRGARRVQSLNNLKNVGIAVSNHYVRHDRLPPATVRSDAGEPLHGWATELLPILDQAGIYREIDHGKPWDHPDNGQATHVVVEVFQNPGVRDRAWYRGGQRHRVDEQGYGLIHYAGNEHVLRDGTSLALEEIDDGLGSTLLIGEINAGFSPWAKPANVRDPALGFGNDAARFGSPYEGIVQFLFCDGSVRPINADVDPAVLKALATPNGGEELPPNW